jgi:argininosuccinate lyase
MKKAWGGRFQSETRPSVDAFNASIGFDKRLYKYDIQGSIAYADMLGECGIIPESEAALIKSALEEILQDIENGKVEFDLSSEDIHMNIERVLIGKLGDLGRKLHTGRSRNDQVAVDTRLYLMDEMRQIAALVGEFASVLMSMADKSLYVVMPGYTHMQRAQPVLFSHHLLAYVEMMLRDLSRLWDCYKRTDELPLGAGALAGSTFPIDRACLAEKLGFSRISQNSLDAVADRDFVIEFCGVASILMMHLSRLCEEIILWSTMEFGFLELDDAFATGSSMMPQKKNPDICELIRGKTGRVYGNLMSLLTVMKSLPLAYNKDMQEDKEALFDTVDTLKACLSILGPTLESACIREDRMRLAVRDGFLNATDLADYLAKKGIPFRKAHEIVGSIVAYGIENKKALDELQLDELQSYSPDIDVDVYDVISIDACIRNRSVVGGTAPERVRETLQSCRSRIEQVLAKFSVQ